MSATSKKGGPEILFYHLEHARLMDVLPSLLGKSLERGWRVVVQAENNKQVSGISSALWTYRDDSFLPHGIKSDGFENEQPIYLCDTTDNPNKAAIRFFVEGAQPENIEGYERIVYLFNGHENGHVENARKQWKRLAGEGANATYWAQNERGGWEKKA